MIMQEGIINGLNMRVWKHIISQGEGEYFVRKSGHIFGVIESHHNGAYLFGGDRDYIICKFRIKQKACAQN